MHYYFSSWWGVHVFMHYYFSSWWGVQFVLVHTLLLQFMVRCTCVHALLLQFMVRCTCDKVCPGSCITTSVHGEVYMCTPHQLKCNAWTLQFMNWGSTCDWFMHYYFSSWWGVHVIHELVHATTSVHGEVYMWQTFVFMHYYFSSWWGVHVFMHYYFSSWWGVSSNVFMHYYFSSWWGVHVIKFVLVHALLLQFMVRCTCVHALLLQFMVRCTCDKVCPGSYITTSVHGEVYMCSCTTSQFMVRCTWGVQFMHYYFSSWWGVHVITFVLVHALLLQFMVRCTCDKVCPGSYITTSVHGEVYT